MPITKRILTHTAIGVLLVAAAAVPTLVATTTGTDGLRAACDTATTHPDLSTARWARDCLSALDYTPTPTPPVSPTPTVPDPTPTAPTWPDHTTTGVPPGTVLTPSGSLTITTPGTVLDRRDITGCLNIRADNVTIRRSRIRGACDTGTINTGDGTHSGIVIDQVEVDGQSRSTSWPCIAYAGFTARRVNAHHCGTGIRLGPSGVPVVIEDSFIHDSATELGSHNAAIAGHGTANLTVRGSRLECLVWSSCSSAMSLYSDDAVVHHVVVERNSLAGGGYGLYGGGSVAHDVIVRDNTWPGSRGILPGPEYGPVTQWACRNTWERNTWADGTPIPPDNC